jgi:hypothetical protein
MRARLLARLSAGAGSDRREILRQGAIGGALSAQKLG